MHAPVPPLQAATGERHCWAPRGICWGQQICRLRPYLGVAVSCFVLWDDDDGGLPDGGAGVLVGGGLEATRDLRRIVKSWPWMLLLPFGCLQGDASSKKGTQHAHSHGMRFIWHAAQGWVRLARLAGGGPAPTMSRMCTWSRMPLASTVSYTSCATSCLVSPAGQGGWPEVG